MGQLLWARMAALWTHGRRGGPLGRFMQLGFIDISRSVGQPLLDISPPPCPPQTLLVPRISERDVYSCQLLLIEDLTPRIELLDFRCRACSFALPYLLNPFSGSLSFS